MSIIKFPKQNTNETENRLDRIEAMMQKRFGVSVDEYMASGQERTQETQDKIDRALRKETMRYASMNN